MTGGIAVLVAVGRPDLAAAGAAGPEARRHLGRDLQRRRRAVRVAAGGADPARLQDLERGDDLRDADTPSRRRWRSGAAPRWRSVARSATGRRGSATPTRRIWPGSMPPSPTSNCSDFKSGARVNAVMTPFAASERPGDDGRRGLLRLSAARAVERARRQPAGAGDRG